MPIRRDPALRFESEHLSRLLAWWRERCGTLGHLPARRDFDPVAMKDLLPYVYMVDVEGDGSAGAPLRFRWRLIGTELTAMADRNATGRWFHDLYARDTYDDFTASYAEAVRSRRPIRTTGTMAFSGAARDFLPYEALKVPLAGDGLLVDLLIGLVAPKGLPPPRPEP